MTITKKISKSSHWMNLTFCMILGLTLLNSCTQDSVIGSSAEDEKILNYLKVTGFDDETLSISGDEITYGDAILNKAAVVETMNSKNTIEDNNQGEISSRQRIQPDNHALTFANSDPVKIWIAPSITNDLGNSGFDATQAAINAFQAVENSTNFKVDLKVTNNKNSADVIIASDLDLTVISNSDSKFYDLATYWTRHDDDKSNDNSTPPAALAYLAWSGVPGNLITVRNNLDNIAHNTLKSIIMHEIGHTLGFRHTMTGEGHHIHGTRGRDNLSIMRPIAQTTGNFTTGDSKAFRLIYPKELDPPTVNIQKHSGVTMRLNFDVSKTKPAYWLRVKRFTNGVETGTFDVIARSDGKTFIANHPSGRTTVKVAAMNYKKDLISNFVNATGAINF